ncbi:hypothetical protein CsSME_00001911 [Camellia sinensis var. sinensis]
MQNTAWRHRVLACPTRFQPVSVPDTCRIPACDLRRGWMIFIGGGYWRRDDDGFILNLCGY